MAIRHKRKTTGGYTWQTTDLVEGQLGINLVDGTLHVRDSVGTIHTILNETDTDAAYATAAQGALADSALQSESNDLTASVTWANVPDANITESSVTQHQAALSITESQISDLGTYLTGITGESITSLSDVFSSMTPTDGQVLTYDTTNGWQAEDATGGGGGDVVDDTTPQLGGKLDVNGNNIANDLSNFVIFDNDVQVLDNTGSTVTSILATIFLPVSSAK